MSKNTNPLYYFEEHVSLLLVRHFEENRPATIVDFGCGDGGILYSLKLNNLISNLKVYAIDASAERINRVKKFLANIKTIIAPVENAPELKKSSMVLVISTMVLEHLKDEMAMLKEANRVLKNNGYIYVTTVYKKMVWMVFS